MKRKANRPKPLDFSFVREDLPLFPELKVAVKAAMRAGAALREAFWPATPTEGGEASPDTAAEQLIRRQLAKKYPRDSFRGEETGYVGALAPVSGAEMPPPQGDATQIQRCWVVDPNDGTSAYRKGFRGAAVSIALLVNGAPVLGVVYAYNHPGDAGDLITWVQGDAVRRDGKPVNRVWPDEPSPAWTVLLSYQADQNPLANAQAASPLRYRAIPSIAYRLALIAVGEGEAAVSLNGPTSWDVAGGHAILIGAGGDLYDQDGKPVRYTADGRCPVFRGCFGGPFTMTEYLRCRPWNDVFARSVERLNTGLPGLCEPWPRRRKVDPGVLDRAQGCLLGQLAGDSLGSVVEFAEAAEIAQRYPGGLRKLVDGGYWNTIAGQPTDDSEMALILARTLVRLGTYNQAAVREAYQAWLASGPFDVGTTTRSGLRGHPLPESQANGSLMRISPLGIFGVGRNPEELAEWARQDAALTHPHPVCAQVGAIYVKAIAAAIETGLAAAPLYKTIVAWANQAGVDASIQNAVEQATDEHPADFTPQAGWVLHAFRNALWQLLHAPGVEAGIVDTVSRGGDTDTNGAICGALLGAVYGRCSFPARWVKSILSCRPLAGLPGVARPRPPAFWPVDAPILAENLVSLI